MAESKKIKFTFSDMAELLDMSTNALGKCLRGEKEFAVEKVEKIEEKLKIKLDKAKEKKG
jgi:hypothetical protein